MPKHTTAAKDRPFTLDHFERWTRRCVLDTGKHWHLEDFQAEFSEDLFGPFSEVWLIIPEGNAKTTLIAGHALYHIEHRPEASVPIAASSRDQGEILYRQADGLIFRSELLGFRPLEGYRRIRFDAQRSRIQIFAADEGTGDGPIPTLAVTEELHRHRSLGLYRTWRGKLGKRKGAKLCAISTAGQPGGEFETARKRILKESPQVLHRGSFTRAASRSLVLHDWAVPKDADVMDLKVVKAANPLRAVTLASLREKRDSPTFQLSHWKRLTCNIAERDGEMSAISEKEWTARGPEAPGHPGPLPEGVPVALGLDVAWMWDTTAAVPFHNPEPHVRLFGPALVFVPPRDGTMLDGEVVRRGLLALNLRNAIHTVVMDRSRAEELARWIEDTLGAVVIDRSQTNTAAVADYEAWMEAMRSGWLWHSGDQALTVHTLNAVARVLPGGDTRFDRPSQTRQGGDQERRVIDALTAASMVHTEMTRTEAEDEPSVYEDDPYRILI